jgi:hypothetical protein
MPRALEQCRILGGMGKGEPSWRQTLVMGLVALAATSVIVGGVVGVLAALGARVVGVGVGEGAGTAAAPQSVYMPPYRHTPQAPVTDGPTPYRTHSAAPHPSKRPHARHKRRDITLSASPAHVAAGQRIHLNGTDRGGGATVEVQRREGGRWVSFSGVTATVRGSTFSTFVYTGRTGVNLFRVEDARTGRSSNPVRVVVG